MHYEVKELAFTHDALEPYLDRQTMELHHGKHLAAYVSNLNALIGKYGLGKIPTDLAEFAAYVNTLDVEEGDRRRLSFNAGGMVNHNFYFELLGAPDGIEPDETLSEALKANFESVENFKDAFRQAALGIMGSGWTWLCFQANEMNPKASLFICNTSNHDSPLSIADADRRGQPVLCLDLWEHAYYLKYQNRRAEFIDAFWSVINWRKVGELYGLAATGYATMSLAKGA
ncbi:MAG: superoxide dismutase [Puniceicoccales bacterium]|nr:superoxide dismutase [Puniceicoccales bacterium]